MQFSIILVELYAADEFSIHISLNLLLTSTLRT